MKISNFILYQKYKISDLVEAFNNKAFYYGQGMVYDQKTNILVLTSKYTKNRMYQDEIKDGLIYYTGMGQEGDQQLAFGNKRLANAKADNTLVYMFLVYKEGEYTYYGRVELNHPYFFEDELDKNGAVRKVFKFPLSFVDALAPLSNKAMNDILSGGIYPIPSLNVVGACIIDGGKLLCAQRADNKNEGGKWEFVGGKVEDNETQEEALKRELKEELGIDVQVNALVDKSSRYDKIQNLFINLNVYSVNILSGKPQNKEHKNVCWKEMSELESLDWASSDVPIVQTLLESQPGEIVETIDFKYKKPVKKVPKPIDLKRACQDYEKSQKKKMRSGEAAEKAVIKYEINKLNALGRSDLASMIKQVSKESSDYGYDILSFEFKNGKINELHIEVKSASFSNGKIEFFVSQAELTKYVEDENYRIFALLKYGLVNYKLHVVKKEEFLSDNNYCSPITYKVSIPVEEF